LTDRNSLLRAVSEENDMTPLLSIVVASIYEVNGVKVPLPPRLARCTPDMKQAIRDASMKVEQKGGILELSDLFRSYDMQLGSHNDYVSGRKKAFSPPPGGSLHEAGRSLDLSIDALGMSLTDFWKIAAKTNLVPIISEPKANLSEAWHFECRGSHQLVYDYYKAKKGSNFDKPYQAMAASAIVSVGVRVDKFGDGQQQAAIQSAIIRLGQVIGNIDGRVGQKTLNGLDALGIQWVDNDQAIQEVTAQLEAAFPEEYFDKTTADPPIS
jgi:hypothetical protein